MNTQFISNFFRSVLVVSVFFIFGAVIKDVDAQTCGGGTTTISTATTSQFATTISNQCLNVTSLGSITVPDGAFRAVNNNSSSGFIVNNAGTISTGITANGIYNGGTIESITNSGTISSVNWQAIYNNYGDTIGSITNSGTISSTLTNAIYNNGGTIGTITNTGTISSVNRQAIYNNGGTIESITNSGTISSTLINAIYNDGGTIGTITNTGTISSGTSQAFDNSSGTLATLNNSQGAGNSAGALTYGGALPTNYNIIINSPMSYGKLAVTSGTGTTTFGIYTGSTVRNGTYAAVLSSSDNTIAVTSTSGKYGSASWLLSPEAPCLTSCIYDLIISGIYTGPSLANTNQSLINTASVLQGTYTLQNSVLSNSFTYDCTVFGANDVCVSAGGRNTQVQAANGLNNTSALLIAAYRPHPNYRIGAYADQNLSVSNPGGTVNLGNNTPLIGLFGAWSERLDGTGTEVKVSAAYGQKNTTMTRSVVGSGATASEAGSGSSTLNSQGVQVTAKYGFGIMDKVIVSPYVGVRYTSNTMGGYSEQATSSVTAPLTYSALNTNATTALAGVGASYRVIPTVMTFASAGVETDTNTANGTYTATNASIGTLTPVNFNANPVRTRPTATVGAYYDIEKNQRLGITGIYRQEAYQAVSTTTVMATYTIGL
ncbi:autotransporter outer membrane beta-barrel domain-containing protein [Polynucleobacter paneuropaeus]|nr:autotransporter outer membrane beta-barrel domain-containing protein [Polynucleobacter paneuropaeus]